MGHFPVKRLDDGRAMLNLACGGRMHPAWNNVDFSPLARLARHPRAARLLHALRILSDRRYERLGVTDRQILCWDLRRGIPFDDDTFDVVYHSHFLEHLEREAARRFLCECHRVVRRGGLLRVVVPDLETLCRAYLESCARQPEAADRDLAEHEQCVHDLIAQMIPTGSSGAREQIWPVRWIEARVRGDSIAAAEAHRWMYDRFTLRALLQSVGFADVQFESPAAGRVKDWPAFGLDTNADGHPYKPQSLYVEAEKSGGRS